MKAPCRTDSHPGNLRWSDRILINTRPLIELAGPVGIFEGLAGVYQNLYTAWQAARQAAGVAYRAMRFAATALDDELRGVALAILTVDGGRRQSEVYRRYFVNGYGRAIRRRPPRALTAAAGVIQGLQNEPNPDIRARLERLQTAYDKLTAALAAYQAARDAVGQQRNLLEEAALAWRKGFLAFSYAVRAQYSDRRSFVESLFKKPGPSGSSEEETLPPDGSGEEPAPETPPAAVPVPVPPAADVS